LLAQDVNVKGEKASIQKRAHDPITQVPLDLRGIEFSAASQFLKQ